MINSIICMDKSASGVSFVCQKIIEITFGGLFFLTPLIFTTINYELFEFNKMFLVYLTAIIILTAWLIKMVSQRRLIFQKTPLFWPLLIFFSSQLLATLTSISLYTSFWGYYTRQNGGLLSYLVYALLYFAFTANIGSAKTKQYLKIMVLSLFLVSGYGILQKAGIDNHLWSQDVPARIFSTLGQPNWLAAWIDGLIFLTIAFFEKKEEKSKKILFLIIFAFAFSALIFTRSRSGFLAFWLIYFLALAGSFFIKTVKIKKTLLLFGCLAIGLTFLFLSPFPSVNRYLEGLSPTNPQSLPKWNKGDNPDLGSATADIRKTVWLGAIKVFQDHPILGTGPETFAYSYYWHQPQSHNLLSEWDFLYNKAHNEYLNFLATSGIVGLLAYLTLMGVSLKLFWKSRQKKLNLLVWALGAGYLTILITNFFGFSVVATNLLFFLMPAFVFTLQQKQSDEDRLSVDIEPFNERQKIFVIILTLAGLNLLFGLAKYWLADYYFAQGEKNFQQGNYPQAYPNYQKAQHLRPQESFYTNKTATNCAYLAIIFNQEGNQEEANKFTVLAQELAQKTINQNPYQVNFYRQQSQTYYLLSSLEPKYQKSAYQLLLKAHRLAPVNPKITYNLGILAHQQGNPNQAISWLETTIQLKPDYQDGYYWLARFYQENGQKDKAKEKLQFLVGNLNPEYPEGKKLLEEITK